MEINGVTLHPEQLFPGTGESSHARAIDEATDALSRLDTGFQATLASLNHEWYAFAQHSLDRYLMRELAGLVPFFEQKTRVCKVSEKYTFQIHQTHFSVGFLVRFLRAIHVLLKEAADAARVEGDEGGDAPAIDPPMPEVADPILVDVDNLLVVPPEPSANAIHDRFCVTATLNFLLALIERLKHGDTTALHAPTVHASLFNVFLAYFVQSHHLFEDMPETLDFGHIILAKVEDARQHLVGRCLAPVSAALEKSCSDAVALVEGLGITLDPAMLALFGLGEA